MDATKLDQIEGLLENLNREEQLTLIEHIAQRLRHGAERTPQPLYGIWKGKFPEDADIDEALHEIRNRWQEDSEHGGK